MASITPVNNGEAADDTWPDAITSEVNRTTSVILTGDVSKATSSWSDITGLTAPVVNGRRYLVRATLGWSQSSTSGGIRIGVNHPGGQYRALARFTGETAADALITEFHTAVDDGAGVATADASGVPRMATIEGWYKASANGTFALRYYRNSAGTATVLEGSGFTLIADA